MPSLSLTFYALVQYGSSIPTYRVEVEKKMKKRVRKVVVLRRKDQVKGIF